MLRKNSGLRLSWRYYTNKVIAAELSTVTRYYDEVIQWLPRPEDTGILLDLTQARSKRVVREDASFPDLSNEPPGSRIAVLMNGTINHHLDIQGLLTRLRTRISRGTRVILVAYNPYLSWLYILANWLGIRGGEVPTTFVTQVDLSNIAMLAGYRIVRTRPVAFSPWRLFGLGAVINWLLPSIPVLRSLGFASVVVLRPLPVDRDPKPSLSCIIPARNERGNIENAIRRLPDLNCDVEVIFVEGHSTDGTWQEILRVLNQFSGPPRMKLAAYQQTGKGKADAVRLGFAKAQGELLTILDADLTMPPELLGRFYQAYADGHGDFINGSRLVYPMEGEAMRFLNRLGNVFFAKALSWVLDVRIGDSLCGTKLMSRDDYRRMTQWREEFGDFDPFGDFELIFPAAVLGLGIVDVPIHYKSRTYGATNISRFRHGLMLLRMTLVGFFRIRTGRLNGSA